MIFEKFSLSILEGGNYDLVIKIDKKNPRG